jgi:alkanesulfonate monooxygenase SsuD/methylene tetrahydromethanopterin reductase-like flavin-dependent oxidoreductase (luciferase family)
MIQTWHFSEAAYPLVPDDVDSLRVTVPNGLIDPKIAAGLWDRYLEEWQIADELGMNLMTNEHHSTVTCMTSASPIIAGVLARLTTQARILILGNPIGTRPDPVRLAEEMAIVDLLSKGRLECGLVRGVPFEMSATNANPVATHGRFWEAHDLLLKAWTTHDGPFNWQGRYFEHRQVNIVPRPFQQPHPPLWMTAGSTNSAIPIAEHGYVMACFLLGIKGTLRVFQAYRDRYAEVHGDAPAPDRLAFAALVCVGETDEQAIETARKLMWYVRAANRVSGQFFNPPGYVAPKLSATVLRTGRPMAFDLETATPEQLIEQGSLFAGNPDTVYRQIERFHEQVGGFGHLLCMAQAGHMTHDEVAQNLTLFATGVQPRLQHLSAASVL